MAAYQIPQFLDSGEKILGPLNLRQFGYALAGFIICTLIFTIFSPSMGNYAVIPCLPFFGLAAYLALGKYNGRDSEIYVLKYILFLVKPRVMVYTRVPELDDLKKKELDLTYDKIYRTWMAEVAKRKQLDQNVYTDFNNQDPRSKIELIRNLSRQTDMPLYSALATIKSKEMQIQANEALLNMMKQKIGYNSLTTPNIQQILPQQQQIENPIDNFLELKAK
jgi:hypothetical protein